MTDPTVGVRTCKACATPLPPYSGSGRVRVFCSLACRKRSYRGSADHTIACATCSAPFTSRNAKAKYCSPVCREPEAKRCTTDGCDRPLRARGLCGMCWKRAYGKRTRYLITCVVCGEQHQSERPDGKYCSDRCKGTAHARRGAGPHSKIPPGHPAHPQWQGRLLPALYAPRRHRRELALPVRPLRRRWYAGQCRRCSAWFIDDQPARNYCSHRCGKGDAKDRYRARKSNAFVENVYRVRVFTRDGWRCQLCNKKTKPNEVVPHPLAPVIDHIIPLARGGTHEPTNVQCAHFMCNSLKGDRGEPHQIMLIG